MIAADVALREVATEASPKRFSIMAIRTVVAGALGEGLEIYDFLVFSFFAVYISRSFFPQQGPTQSLLLTVATLGLGFVTRPLGAFYLGMYADRFGKRWVAYAARTNTGWQVERRGFLAGQRVKTQFSIQNSAYTIRSIQFAIDYRLPRRDAEGVRQHPDQSSGHTLRGGEMMREANIRHSIPQRPLPIKQA
jgi:hypothetical protein